jgi:hypothetical protein
MEKKEDLKTQERIWKEGKRKIMPEKERSNENEGGEEKFMVS